MADRKAFTLIEVLISIALMGIIMIALFSSVDMMQNSNSHLLQYLKKSKTVTIASKTLYIDILGSDGNITIEKDEFSRVCMEETRNSLYALPSAKVCWLVLKKDNTLVRVEGNGYHLPLLSEERVEVDPVMREVALFDVYYEKDKILVLLQQEGEEPITFLVQSVSKPEEKKKPVAKTKVTPAAKPAAAPTPPPSTLTPPAAVPATPEGA